VPTLAISVTLITGCSTTRTQSEVPDLLLKAKALNFNKEQKTFVGLLLHRINYYESRK
jgi:hypothetical protein